MFNPTEEFNRGWFHAAQHEYSLGKKQSVMPCWSGAFKEGYIAFWENRATELAIAEIDCIADYDGDHA